MMNTLTPYCQWEDEMVRERTGHPPLYAKAKKMNTSYQWLPRASLRDYSSSFSLAKQVAKYLLFWLNK